MKNVLLVLFLTMSGTAIAANPDSRPADAVETFLASFNAGDVDAAELTQTNDVVIVDEFAPFQWRGEGSFRRWLDALTAHDAAGGITGGHMATVETIREEASDDRAYLVIATAYTFDQNGVAMRAPAQMTFALVKQGHAWRISAWTYSAPSATPVNPVPA